MNKLNGEFLTPEQVSQTLAYWECEPPLTREFRWRPRTINDPPAEMAGSTRVILPPRYLAVSVHDAAETILTIEMDDELEKSIFVNRYRWAIKALGDRALSQIQNYQEIMAKRQVLADTLNEFVPTPEDDEEDGRIRSYIA